MTTTPDHTRQDGRHPPAVARKLGHSPSQRLRRIVERPSHLAELVISMTVRGRTSLLAEPASRFDDHARAPTDRRAEPVGNACGGR
jgi:hypothetical protein